MTDNTGCYHDTPTAIETHRGGRFDVDAPAMEAVHPVDIAHALSLTCRYMGQCRIFYSVAEHSIYCHDEARRRGLPPAVCLMCLLHDGAEAYVGDVGRPVKQSVDMGGFAHLEGNVQETVYARFRREIGDDWCMTKWKEGVIKEIDNAVLKAEAQRLMAGKGKDWGGGFDRIKPAVIPWWQWLWHRLPWTVERGFLNRLKRYGVRW